MRPSLALRYTLRSPLARRACASLVLIQVCSESSWFDRFRWNRLRSDTIRRPSTQQADDSNGYGDESPPSPSHSHPAYDEDKKVRWSSSSSSS